MVTEIKLPQYSMGLTDGLVGTWLKQVGDHVEEGEEIAEVEEAKVTEVITSPVKGVILEIFVPEGELVPVRTVICTIGDIEETQQNQPKAPPKADQPAPEQEEGQKPVSDQETIVPMTGMRETIAKRMSESLSNSAQFTLNMQADVTDLVKQREALKIDDSVKVSVTDIIIKACALTLKSHPRLNGWSENNQVRLLSDVHIGLAIALEEGLIVPVIRNADQKSLYDISVEAKELAKKAKDESLSTNEVTGSTFTITNLGMMGVRYFTPIINMPEIAILGVGALIDYPEKKNGDLVWRKGLPLSLTIDHKAVDGAPAAIFLQDLREYLEQLDLRKL